MYTVVGIESIYYDYATESLALMVKLYRNNVVSTVRIEGTSNIFIKSLVKIDCNIYLIFRKSIRIITDFFFQKYILRLIIRNIICGCKNSCQSKHIKLFNWIDTHTNYHTPLVLCASTPPYNFLDTQNSFVKQVPVNAFGPLHADIYRIADENYS